jgi:hypothetical protein
MKTTLVSVVLGVLALSASGCGGEESDGDMAFNNQLPTEWGVAKPIPPNPAGPGFGNIGQPVRLVNLAGDTTDAEIVSVGLSSQDPQDPTNGAIFHAGPLVGIVEFGNAGGSSRIEFDVVAQDPFPLLKQASAQGGAMVNVPTSSIQAYLRNDANVIPSPGDDPIGVDGINATGSGWAAYGRTGGAITRTVYWLRRLAGLATPVTRPCPIPPYARTFQVFATMATPGAADVSVDVSDAGGAVINRYKIPAATPYPPVFPIGTGVGISITVAAGTLLFTGTVVFGIQNGG